MSDEPNDDQIEAGLSGDLPLYVAAQRVDIGNVRADGPVGITADVRLTIELQNGNTYTVTRRMRLKRHTT